MIVHLIDGTYELFRHFYGLRRFKKTDPPFGAVVGVLRTVVQMIEDGATHLELPLITSSNRSATNFGRTTKPAREWSRHCSRNSIRSRKHLWRWVLRLADDRLRRLTTRWRAAAHLAAAG